MSTPQLLGDGWSHWQIQQAVRRERLRRLRRGWYAVPHADPEVVRAVSSGGVLGCISALRRHGVWVPHDTGLHIRVGTSRPPARPGVRICPAHSRDPSPGRAVDPVAVALAAALRCLGFEGCLVVVDSVLNRKLMTATEVAGVVQRLHGRHGRLLAACDPQAQSGTETIVRHRLRGLGLSVRSQVGVATVGWVDLMVGDRLVIEVDSHAHHTSLENYSNDRRRDRRLAAMGYLVVRLSYHQVLFNWSEVEPDLLAIIRRGDHRWPRGRGAAPADRPGYLGSGL